MRKVLNGQYRKLYKKYVSLQKRYRQLERNYRAISKRPELLKEEVKIFFQKRVTTFVPMPIALAGIIYYHHYSVVLLGLLAMIGDIAWENYTTKWGLWRYRKSRVYMIFGRIPVEVPITYFFLGAAIATYILFRVGYVPGA